MHLCCWYRSQSMNSLFLYKELIFISNLHQTLISVNLAFHFLFMRLWLNKEGRLCSDTACGVSCPPDLQYRMWTEAFPGVLVCQFCHDNYHRLGGWTIEIYFLTALEAGSSTSRCWQSWLLLKPLSLTCRPLAFLLCPYMVFFLCACLRCLSLFL